MTMTRRRALGTGIAAAAAAGLTPMSSLASAGSASRRFEVLRGGDPIGEHVTTVTSLGDSQVQVGVTVELAVKILGITAYRYEMQVEERWTDGRLDRLISETNDDGTAERADVRRENDVLISSGTWTGQIAGPAATTTYWSPEFLDRPTWISTQSGEPLSVALTRQGEEEIEGLGRRFTAQRWRATGDLPVTLFFDDRNEWMGNAFDAGGTEARFRATSETGPLAPLWTAA
ncbi:MAG: DUF6134 family protein [Pseudomonadota bacterium]